MKIKTCSRCKLILSLDNFTSDKTTKDGLEYVCKNCKKEYRLKNRERIRKNYKDNYKLKYHKNSHNYYIEHKDIKLKQNQIYIKNNKNKIINYKKKYYKLNKNEILIQKKVYYKNNKEKINKYKKDYYDKNKNNSVFKITKILRRRILFAIKDNHKSDKTINLLGCSIDQFLKYLQETAIKNGYVNFDINNYSGREYHIDHIIPCSKFNLKCSYHQQLCFNYTNLQILTVKENLIKSDTY